MAKIFYRLAGEVRGHAARVRSMVELLRHEHEIVIFAPEQAFEFLAPRYPGEAAEGTPNTATCRHWQPFAVSCPNRRLH